ncbi:hypothetical protein J3R83DRAFT_11454 [Lanmaoa asiatica]|nr:hypothetical protein J3R83DRAFT_11454 [Lanmaoa asiatica]
MTVDASSFHLCNTTARSLGTTSFPQAFAVYENSRARSDREGKCSPTRTGLPSLASALSNESLDENVNLTGLGPAETAGECLPLVLRPLRLSGPIRPESEPDSSHIFQIDPVLLSFNYPGLGLSESGSTSSGADTMPFALPSSTASATSPMTHITGLCRVRASSDAVDVESLNMPALERSDPSDEHDSPDSSFECAAAHVLVALDGTSAEYEWMWISARLLSRWSVRQVLSLLGGRGGAGT